MPVKYHYVYIIYIIKYKQALLVHNDFKIHYIDLINIIINYNMNKTIEKNYNHAA